MILNELTGLALDEWTAKALIEAGLPVPEEYHPSADKLQCWQLSEDFNVSILPVPNTDLYQAKANGRVIDDNAPVVYNTSRTDAVCLAVVGFAFGERDTLLGDMYSENQKIIEEVFGG